MAYLGFAIYVGETGAQLNDVTNWTSRRPTYITYSGNTTTYTLNQGQWATNLYTDTNGSKYAIYVFSTNEDVAQFIGGGTIDSSWMHNDTATNAHPATYMTNVDNGRDVYLYENDTPFTNVTVMQSGTKTLDIVWHYSSYWNCWRTLDVNQGTHEIGNKITNIVALDDTLRYYGGVSVALVYLRNTPNSYGSNCRVAIVRNNLEEYETDTTGTTENNLFDFSRKALVNSSNPAQAVAQEGYREKVYAIHNVGKQNKGYVVGYFGTATGGITSNPSYGYNKTRSNTAYNTWLSFDVEPLDSESVVNTYYAITVDGNSKFIKQEIPVQLGYNYIFNLYVNAQPTYDGIVLSKAELSTPSTGSSMSTLYSSNTNVISYVVGNGGSDIISYSPSEDGTLYMYYRTNSSTIRYNNATSTTCTGDVMVTKTPCDPVLVTFDKASGSGGTNSVSITPGTAAADYPAITLPTRSGYIFQGYFDDATGGTAYYNAAGQGTRIFNKVSATTLYAHWQQESLPTRTVTLNDNGGYGGQGTANVVSGQMIGTVTVPSRDGFKFLGYYNKYNTAPGGSGQYKYVDETGTGCRTISSNITLYALWENTISYELLYSVQSPKIVTYSTSSQNITVSDGGWVCAGGTMSNIQYTFEGGGTVSSSDGGLSFTIPSKDVATYTLSVTLTSPTSAVANGYFGMTQTYSFGVRYIQKNIEFHLLGQEVYSPNTAQAKVKAEVAGTLYWGTSSSSMASTQSVTAGLSSWTSITGATQTSVGTKTIYGYFAPSSNNYNWVGGVDNPGDSAVLTVLTPVSQTVTITLNDNGGSGGSGSIVVQKDSSVSNWPNVGIPTRAGFTFIGYFTVSAATGGTQVYDSYGNSYYSSYSTSSNVTIYARWKINISYTHNNTSAENAITSFVSDQPGEATSTTSSLTLPISGGQVTCVVSSLTFSVIDKTGWSINSTGTSLTIPSGTSYTYSPTCFRYSITVADGTYNNFPYVGNTLTSGYSFNTDMPRPIYYHLKRVEYVKVDGYFPVKYKDMNGTPGYNITNAPTPGNGNTIYGPYYDAYVTGESTRYISNSMTNDTSWYQKYTNGTWDTTLKRGTEGVYGVWRIISETFTPADGGTVQNITRSHATDTAVASQLLINGNYYTVYRAYINDYCFIHESMEGNLGTDNLVVRIYNPSDPSKYAEITKSVTNSLYATKYADASGSTQGYASMDCSIPYLSIVPNPSGRDAPFLASSTRASVYCSAENYATWYQKCSSSAYVLLSGTVITSARWRILSQNCVGGTDRFSFYTGVSSSITVGGSSYTVYNNGNEISHATMGTNAGDDTVAVIAYNLEDLSKTITSSVTVTNGYTETSTGVSSYGTPTLTLTSNLTASNGNVIVNCSVTNSIRFRRNYDSGSSSTFTSAVPGVARWAIATNGSNRFSPSGTGTAFSNLTVYNDGDSIAHSTMSTWAGTDTVVVRAYNMLSTKTTPSTSKSASVNNSIVSSGQPTIVSYGTPTVTIGTGISAGGGSATVTCNVSNTQRVVNTYTTGDTSNVDSLVAGTAKWMITSQSGGRCSPSGTSSTVGSSTMYNSGGTVQHTTMGSNVGTDSVTVTAYNVSSTAKTAAATASTSNAYESLKISGAANSISFGASTSGSVYASFTSGAEVDVTDSIAVNAASGNRIVSSNTNIITIS